MTEGIVNCNGEFYGRYELEEDETGFCTLIIKKPSERSRVINSKDEGRRVVVEPTEDIQKMTGIKAHLEQQLQILSLELVEE